MLEYGLNDLSMNIIVYQDHHAAVWMRMVKISVMKWRCLLSLEVACLHLSLEAASSLTKSVILLERLVLF